MPSKKTRVTTVKRLSMILDWMLANWTAKTIAVMGNKNGPGGVQPTMSVRKLTDEEQTRAKRYGENPNATIVDPLDWGEVDEGTAVFAWDERIPDPKTAKRSPNAAWQDDTRTLYRSGGMITQHDAEEIIREVGRRAVLELRRQTMTRPGYRIWLGAGISARIMEWEIRDAQQRYLPLALLDKGKRRGIQRIITTKRRVPVGFSRFNGYAALRMPRGRPPLPEAVWRNRYMARLENRRRNNTTKIRRKRGIVRVPPTQSPRPPAPLTLGPIAKPWEL